MAQGGSVKIGDMVYARVGANVNESYGGTGLIIGQSQDLRGMGPRWAVLWSKTGHVQSHGKMELRVVS